MTIFNIKSAIEQCEVGNIPKYSKIFYRTFLEKLNKDIQENPDYKFTDFITFRDLVKIGTEIGDIENVKNLNKLVLDD